jgi:hypothetical protein
MPHSRQLMVCPFRREHDRFTGGNADVEHCLILDAGVVRLARQRRRTLGGAKPAPIVVGLATGGAMGHRAVLAFVAWTTCAAAIGCATPNRVTYSAINVPPRPLVRRAAADVEVVVGNPPGRSHVDVGLFEIGEGSTDDGAGLSTESMIATLRLHAALRGCDAVQVLGVAYREEYKPRYARHVVTAVCKMYNDEQAQRAAGQARTAPPAPLADEGKSCTPPIETDPAPYPSCREPLVCSNKVCASPYR